MRKKKQDNFTSFSEKDRKEMIDFIIRNVNVLGNHDLMNFQNHIKQVKELK